MAARKREAPPPAPRRKPARVPAAAEVPVTRAMLTEMRTELIERIDQSKEELRAEIAGVRSELKAEIAGLRSEVHELKAEMHGMKAEMHGMKAEIARLGFLIEEQNARNKIVLDGLMSFIDRQNRIEQRMDRVEDTVRGLASARAAS